MYIHCSEIEIAVSAVKVSGVVLANGFFISAFFGITVTKKSQMQYICVVSVTVYLVDDIGILFIMKKFVPVFHE
jgi:hypothetical protein